MTDFVINDYILHKECESLAKDIFDDVMEEAADDEDAEYHRETMMDQAHEAADGHSWVIYNHKALMLCAHCGLEYGEDFLSDIGFQWQSDSTIYTVAGMIAYGEIRGRVECILSDMIDEWKAA